MAGIASTKPPIIYNGQKTMIWSDNRYCVNPPLPSFKFNIFSFNNLK